MEHSKLGRILKFSDLDYEEQELVKASVNAREYSYSPYSKFKVGAAARWSTGKLVSGCNVENFSYPVGVCAERVTISKAVSEGNTELTAIAVSGLFEDSEKFLFPCGMCLQAITEFAINGDINIYLVKPDLHNVFITSLKILLPQGKLA